MTKPAHTRAEIEYAIWGKDADHAEETLLLAPVYSAQRVQELCRVLRTKGCYDIRVQRIDLAQPLEWDARRMIQPTTH